MSVVDVLLVGPDGRNAVADGVPREVAAGGFDTGLLGEVSGKRETSPISILEHLNVVWLRAEILGFI